MRKPKRALFSLTNKTGSEIFAMGLHQLGVELLSTGGTARNLRLNGLPVTEVADFTGFPEILDGRVKTLHPLIHGGILHQRQNPLHREQCEAQHIQPIDMVVVNLYDFNQAVSQRECSLAAALEQIDIGGPSLLRAAAKNFQDVTVICDMADYAPVINELLDHEGYISLATRFRLAQKVFALTSAYDQAIAAWLVKVHPAELAAFQGGPHA